MHGKEGGAKQGAYGKGGVLKANPWKGEQNNESTQAYETGRIDGVGVRHAFKGECSPRNSVQCSIRGEAAHRLGTQEDKDCNNI